MNNEIDDLLKRAWNRLLRELKISRPKLSPETHGRRWLPILAAESGVGIELGVASGYFSNIILQNSRLERLYSVDAWADHHDVGEYHRCCELLNPHGSRSTVLRMYFSEALDLFPDEHFDFIYIDAYAGDGQEDGQILRDWWPKLKSGGVFSGHDYHEKWQPTIDAVNRFCEEKGYTPNLVPGVSGLHLHDEYGSWYLVKREDSELPGISR